MCIKTEHYFPSLGCECCINSKSYNDWYGQWPWMSDVFFGFDVQFVGDLTYLCSYMLTVWCWVSCADSICPKPYFYMCVITIESIISLQTLCRSPSAGQHGILLEKIVDIHWSLHQIQWKLARDSFGPSQCYRYIVAVFII